MSFRVEKQHALGRRLAQRISASALSMRMRFSSRTKPEVKDAQSFPTHLESEGVAESFSSVEFSALGHLLAIGEALRHYDYVLSEAKKELGVSEVDKKSAMEPAVLNWFYQTPFWHINKSNVELIPQFELGKYLKQLDKSYEHPLYRVDFLLIFREDGKADRKVILEYDGFLEHFADLPGINATNYANYYSEEDVYRQKVLEGYGYRFLRINRFNAGKNPIETLNQRLIELLGKEKKQNQSIESIHSAALLLL